MILFPQCPLGYFPRPSQGVPHGDRGTYSMRPWDPASAPGAASPVLTGLRWLPRLVLPFRRCTCRGTWPWCFCQWALRAGCAGCRARSRRSGAVPAAGHDRATPGVFLGGAAQWWWWRGAPGGGAVIDSGRVSGGGGGGTPRGDAFPGGRWL